MDHNYTPEQIADLNERVNKANKALKDLEIACVANIAPHMIPNTNNVFAFRVEPKFTDLKYLEKTKEEKVSEILEAEVKPA